MSVSGKSDGTQAMTPYSKTNTSFFSNISEQSDSDDDPEHQSMDNDVESKVGDSISPQKNKKYKDRYSKCVAYGKKMATFVAVDWFYIRYAFGFAKTLLPVITKKLETDKVEHTKETEPELPWFQAWGKKEASDESERIQNSWAKYSSGLPSYYRMVLTVFDDLMPKVTHKDVYCSVCCMEIVGKRFISCADKRVNMCEQCECANLREDLKMKLHPNNEYRGSMLHQLIVLLWSCTILGQLQSERGRIIWSRVLSNYWVFVTVCFGFWNNKQNGKYAVDQRIEELKSEDALLVFNDAELKILNKADVQAESIQMLAAVIAPRIVLIQMIPYATLFSSFAVNVSPSPLFVFSAGMREDLPPLFQGQLVAYAEEVLKDLGIKSQWWNTPLLCLYLFVKQSRAIQFIINAVQSAIAIVIVFARDDYHAETVIVFSAIFFAAVAMVNAIYPLILLLHTVFPPEVTRMEREKTLRFQEVYICDDDMLTDGSGLSMRSTMNSSIIGSQRLRQANGFNSVSLDEDVPAAAVEEVKSDEEQDDDGVLIATSKHGFDSVLPDFDWGYDDLFAKSEKFVLDEQELVNRVYDSSESSTASNDQDSDEITNKQSESDETDVGSEARDQFDVEASLSREPSSRKLRHTASSSGDNNGEPSYDYDSFYEVYNEFVVDTDTLTIEIVNDDTDDDEVIARNLSRTGYSTDDNQEGLDSFYLCENNDYSEREGKQDAVENSYLRTVAQRNKRIIEKPDRNALKHIPIEARRSSRVVESSRGEKNETAAAYENVRKNLKPVAKRRSLSIDATANDDSIKLMDFAASIDCADDLSSLGGSMYGSFYNFDQKFLNSASSDGLGSSDSIKKSQSNSGIRLSPHVSSLLQVDGATRPKRNFEVLRSAAVSPDGAAAAAGRVTSPTSGTRQEAIRVIKPKTVLQKDAITPSKAMLELQSIQRRPVRELAAQFATGSASVDEYGSVDSNSKSADQNKSP